MAPVASMSTTTKSISLKQSGFAIIDLQLDSFAVDDFETTIVLHQIADEQARQLCIDMRNFENHIDNL